MAITDAFTGTNGTGLVAYSANWAYLVGATTSAQIQTNALAMADVGNDHGARRTETPFANDHYAQVAISTVGTEAGEVMGVAVRAGAAASGNFYGFHWGDDDGSNYLFEMAGGAWTQIGSTGTSTQDIADVIKLTCSGTTLTPTIQGSGTGTPGAQTDATYATGAPGLAWYNNATNPSVIRVDNYECSSIASGFVPFPLARGMAGGVRGLDGGLT
jgi:hypothetical protein